MLCYETIIIFGNSTTDGSTCDCAFTHVACCDCIKHYVSSFGSVSVPWMLRGKMKNIIFHANRKKKNQTLMLCHQNKNCPFSFSLQYFLSALKKSENESVSHSVVSDPLRPRELCSLPGSSVRGISQAMILEWVVIPFSKGSS